MVHSFSWLRKKRRKLGGELTMAEKEGEDLKLWTTNSVLAPQTTSGSANDLWQQRNDLPEDVTMDADL